jgi:small subunit ribosomal protein S8
MVTDPIADMITQLKNASSVKRANVSLPYSKEKQAIAEILEREGYLKAVTKKGKKIKKMIEVELIYPEGKPKIRGVKRVSKPSRRVYISYKDARPVKSGYGLAIITTPKGILTDSEARKEKVGGELLFNIW